MPINTKEYENDYELLYLISEENEDANELIYKKYDPVISFYAKKYVPYISGKGLDYNDLYQEGLIGLDQAIRSYKDQKEIKFSTFAFLCIKRKIYTAIKNANRKKHSILNESYPIDYSVEEDKLGLSNVISDNSMGIDELLVTKENDELFFNKLNERLTSFEKQVYQMRINEFSYEEIALALNRSIKSIDSSLFRIKQKIKKILEEIN